MMKMNPAWIALSFVPLLSQAGHFQLPVVGGMTWQTLDNSNEVLTVNPAPGLVINEYDIDNDSSMGYLMGAGLVYAFENVFQKPARITFGLMGYYVNLNEVSGVEYPFINAGNFDTLDFEFGVESAAIFLESKFFYTQYPFQPYLLIGLGLGKNRLYDYREYPSDPNSSAAPVPNPFRNEVTNSFAYEIGFGVQHKIAEYPAKGLKCFLSLDWRYLSLGEGELSTMPGQLTGDHLEIENLNTNALSLSIITQF